MLDQDKIKAKRLKFRLYGLPEDYAEAEFSDSLPPTEAARMLEAFSTLRRGTKCYVQGTAGPIANLLDSKGVKVRGLDASVFIDDPFDKSEDSKTYPKADCIIIYNCNEGTTSPQLVQKVLKKLIQYYKNSQVVLQGDATGRAFSKDVLPVQNICSVPLKKEEKFI